VKHQGCPGRGVLTALVLSLDEFEAPLDRLLEMARAKKIDLARLSIAALIEQSAGALATGSPIGHWGRCSPA
jgi:hypothetical protein